MHDRVQTWHYGLVARHWAEHNTAAPELAYFHRQIERYGQPALDAGCGTGRLLIPLLQAGLEVDGCDVSTDMLTLCQEKATIEGLTPRLYAQALHELDLPRRYQTIVVCGTLGLGVPRQQDVLALQHCYQHLHPGGTLLLDLGLPYSDASEWQLWLKGAQERLPEPWPATISAVPPMDGSAYELYSRIVAFDPLEQQISREMRTLLWRDGQLVADEVYALTENLYFRNELRQMLEQVGFKIEVTHGDYTEAAATPEHDVLVFVARKPS